MGIPLGGIGEVLLESCHADAREAREGCGRQKVTRSPSLCLLVRSDRLERAIQSQERNPVLGRQERASLGSMLSLPGSRVSQSLPPPRGGELEPCHFTWGHLV